MLIRTIGVQPTSLSLPKEVFKPRAEMEIKMNSLEISPSVLETFVGIIPVQFKAARAMKPPEFGRFRQTKSSQLFDYQRVQSFFKLLSCVHARACP